MSCFVFNFISIVAEEPSKQVVNESIGDMTKRPGHVAVIILRLYLSMVKEMNNCHDNQSYMNQTQKRRESFMSFDQFTKKSRDYPLFLFLGKFIRFCSDIYFFLLWDVKVSLSRVFFGLH